MDISASRTQPNVFARSLFAGLPARYDRLAEILSFGQNRRWRACMVDHIDPIEGAHIVDVACGPAGVSRLLVKRGARRVTGVDLSTQMLGAGVAKIADEGLRERIGLTAGRGEQLPFADAAFDGLTFTYLLRYVADPVATLVELARVVKPGGAIASLEFAVPANRFWRIAWWNYTRIVLPIAGWLTGGRAWFRVGRFLGPSITNHYRLYPVDSTIDAWEKAGITDVHVRAMSLGGGIIMWGRRAP